MFQTIKRHYQYNFNFLLSIIAAAFLFMLESCISRVDGCLDVAAANFDLNADRSCDDCCTYPLLSISLSQKWNEHNFSSADTLADRNGIQYRITDLNYFLSSWILQGIDHENYTIDSADISCPASNITYTPDIIIVGIRQFDYSLGTIRKSPVIDSIFLKLGLLSSMDCIDSNASGVPPVFSDDSPLWDPHTLTRASIRLILQRNIQQESFDTIYIHDLEDIQLGYDLELQRGISPLLRITVNYALWFMNVDIQDVNSFRSSIEEGLNGSFYKTP